MVTRSKPEQCLYVYKLNHVRREVSRHYRNKRRKKLKAKIDEFEAQSKTKLSMMCTNDLEKGYILQLIQKRMGRVNPIVIWPGGGTISQSCKMYMVLMVLGRLKYRQQSR